MTYTLPGGPLGEHRPEPDPYVPPTPPPIPASEHTAPPAWGQWPPAPPTYLPPPSPPPLPPSHGRRNAILTVVGLIAVVGITLAMIGAADGNNSSSTASSPSTASTSTPYSYSSPTPSYSYGGSSGSSDSSSCSYWTDQVTAVGGNNPTVGDLVAVARIVVAHESCFSSSLVASSERVLTLDNEGDFAGHYNEDADSYANGSGSYGTY